MSEMTITNLVNAFSGESQAHMRYLIYADVAEEEGHKDVARLFRGIAYAEKVHANNHLEITPQEEMVSVAPTPYGIGDTVENLQKGIDGEKFETGEMYPAFKEVAKLQDERDAFRSFKWAQEAEKVHARMFENAMDVLESGEEYEVDTVQVCEVCGYTNEGDAPEKCPICGATKENFKSFD